MTADGKTPSASGGPVTGVGARPGSLVSAVERAGRVSGRRTPSDGGVADDVRAARAGLSAWLTSGREARGWTREHVARITRIPMRTLENLEDGRWSELPADVFVRGFLRSYARCVGLSIDDALAQYAGCGFAAAPVASAQAHALLDSMAPLTAPARATATPITSAPRILGTDRVDDAGASGSLPQMRPADAGQSGAMAASASGAMPASASGSMPAVEVARAVATIVLPDAPPAGGRRRHKRAPTVVTAGSRERDARGRFIRKSVEMAAVADPTIAETGAAADAAPPQLATGSVTRRRISAPVAAVAVTATPVDTIEPTSSDSASTHASIGATTIETTSFDASAIDTTSIDTTSIEARAIDTIDNGSIGAARADQTRADDSHVDADAARAASSTLTAATTTVTVVPPPSHPRFVPPPRRSVPMAAPSLVIDDDDPDDADRAREQRAQAQKDGGWRSFLPPALLDQERGGRQGGLTLAVIILLIVATLTLSYLMRRPSSTGEGVTRAPASQPVLRA